MTAQPAQHDDDDEGDDWSFDPADIAPDTSSLGETLGSEDLEQLERERQEQAQRDQSVRKEVEEQEDEAGRQRRQNVRVNIKYPIVVNVNGYPTSRARTRDLSATGIGFATRMALDVDTAGTVTIEFPEWHFTKQFTVRFVKPILAGRIVGVQFDELTEDERERVVKEVFAVQRAQLQEQRARQKQMAGD